MHPRPLHVRLLLPLVAVPLLLTACSSGEDGPAEAAPATSSAPASSTPPEPSATPGAETSDGASAAGTPAPDTAEPTLITIAGFAYDVPASVEAGTELEVVNEDSEAHTVTFTGGGPSVVVQGGTTAMLAAPDEAGSYPIVCDFHGNMTAELVVT
jgi:plastocyanin